MPNLNLPVKRRSDNVTLGTLNANYTERTISGKVVQDLCALSLPAGRFRIQANLSPAGLRSPFKADTYFLDTTLGVPDIVNVPAKTYYVLRDVETGATGYVITSIVIDKWSGSAWTPYATTWVTLAGSRFTVNPCGASRANQIRGCNMHLFNNDPTFTADHIAYLAELLGAGGIIRTSVPWFFVETANNVYDATSLAALDQVFSLANAAGLKVLCPLGSIYAPAWTTTGATNFFTWYGSNYYYNNQGNWEPNNYNDYEDWVKYFVNRYGGQGLYAIEMGNEPNAHKVTPLPNYDINPDVAVRMATHAKAAIAASNYPATKLVGGVIAFNDLTYIGLLYDNGFAGVCDALSVHPYQVSFAQAGGMPLNGTYSPRMPFPGPDWENGIGSIDDVRALMDARGDNACKLWVTEFGFSTVSGRFGVGPAKQADHLSYSYRQLAKANYLDVAMMHTIEDRGTDPTNWSHNFGLIDYSHKVKKEAFNTLKQTISDLNAGIL